jgi:hypothetical protein
MGKPTVYRVELKTLEGLVVLPWRGGGEVSEEKLAEYVEAYEKSHAPGGKNHYLSKKQVKVVAAKIIEQKTEKVIVEWQSPRINQ